MEAKRSLASLKIQQADKLNKDKPVKEGVMHTCSECGGSGMVEKQLPEKFQFDAGSSSFHNPLDYPADPTDIKTRFPYLFTDLVAGIKAHADEIANPTPEDGIEKKTYDPEKEINLLKTRLAQYWTDKKRPAPKIAEPEDKAPPAAEQPPPAAL